jgi:hypothetical protein
LEGDCITIRATDAYGNVSKVLFEGKLPQGESVINADVTGLAAGCYLCSVTSSSATFTTRLIVFR